MPQNDDKRIAEVITDEFTDDTDPEMVQSWDLNGSAETLIMCFCRKF